MQHFICVTCGTQFARSAAPPTLCPICNDERQYVAATGQKWTSLDSLRSESYRNVFKDEEPGLLSMYTEPTFAIGQRAFFIRTPAGNMLWDCLSYIDEETIRMIREMGGIDTIAISHPHYYSSMVEWADTFDALIYIHEADRQWVMRESDRIHYWSGDTLLPVQAEGVSLLRTGGHFAGSTVLHWEHGAKGQGALLTGDTIQVVADECWVSFMYSYPNLIPLPASEVEHIWQVVEPYEFAMVYGAFGRVVRENGREAVRRSAERYSKAINGEYQIR
ncbi:MBL fold metallo-hydrolase [Aneurinibacillus sp. REN35]|uniref:hypothetical protein n=1 Tax=Aneurinibacillus sp. REN35 TaxID=3237286 RepID=UPI003527B3AF